MSAAASIVIQVAAQLPQRWLPDASGPPLERVQPEMLDLARLGHRGDRGVPLVLHVVEIGQRGAGRAVRAVITSDFARSGGPAKSDRVPARPA